MRLVSFFEDARANIRGSLAEKFRLPWPGQRTLTLQPEWRSRDWHGDGAPILRTTPSARPPYHQALHPRPAETVPDEAGPEYGAAACLPGLMKVKSNLRCILGPCAGKVSMAVVRPTTGKRIQDLQSGQNRIQVVPAFFPTGLVFPGVPQGIRRRACSNGTYNNFGPRWVWHIRRDFRNGRTGQKIFGGPRANPASERPLRSVLHLGRGPANLF